MVRYSNKSRCPNPNIPHPTPSRQCGTTHILSTCTSSPVAVEDVVVGLHLDAFHHYTQLRRMPLTALIGLLDTSEISLGW